MAYIRRLIPCAPYEIKIFEAWLEELAEKEGLFLVSCRRAIAKFEKGTPKPMRYRVDADPDRCWDPSQERQQLYEEFGWKYIDNRSEHLVVYGTDDFLCRSSTQMRNCNWRPLGSFRKNVCGGRSLCSAFSPYGCFYIFPPATGFTGCTIPL